MFAASLNTLKKRATELLKDESSRRKDEAEELGPPSHEALGTLRGLLGNGYESGLADVPIAVRYEVQNGDDDDREIAAFPMPNMGAGVTVGYVRRHFPLPGRFHFRFKAQTPDGVFGGFIWIDLASEGDIVPAFKGEIHVKALRIPDDADGPRAVEPAPGLGGAAPSAASAAQVPVGARSASPPAARSPPPPPPPPELVAAPQQAPPLQAPVPVVPADLMFLGETGDAAPRPQAAAHVQPSAPVCTLSREELVAKREAATKAQVDEAVRRQVELRKTETQTQAAKVHKGNEIGELMDKWAKTGDGQAYKDIKVLLSTVHTVLWENSGWKELPLSELVTDDSAVKRFYRQAILLCHPDKQKEADIDQQVRADRIFQALNEAFKLVGSK